MEAPEVPGVIEGARPRRSGTLARVSPLLTHFLMAVVLLLFMMLLPQVRCVLSLPPIRSLEIA